MNHVSDDLTDRWYTPILERIATACDDFFILIYNNWVFFTGEKRRVFNK